MLGIFAGLMISMGGYLYLTLGGTIGSIFFAIGLMSIVHFKLHLFTGKAGLLATKEISALTLVVIWLTNFIGCALGGIVTQLTPKGQVLAELASAIVEAKTANTFLENMILGIGCGILMYIAVRGYQDTKNLVFVFAPVAAFIIAGFNHCVADMFYLSIGANKVKDFLILIPTTIGNIIGTNLIPITLRADDWVRQRV